MSIANGSKVSNKNEKATTFVAASSDSLTDFLAILPLLCLVMSLQTVIEQSKAEEFCWQTSVRVKGQRQRQDSAEKEENQRHGCNMELRHIWEGTCGTGIVRVA